MDNERKNRQEKDMPEPADFRFGPAAERFLKNVLLEEVPKQIDLLDRFFPGLIVTGIPSDGKTKHPAEFDDRTLLIRAVRFRGSFYTSGSDRVNQIVSRLYGTARSGLEKERKSASLIQRRIAREMTADPDCALGLVLRIAEIMAPFDSDTWERFLLEFTPFLAGCIGYHEAHPSGDGEDVLFPMEASVRECLLDCIITQWNRQTVQGYTFAFSWILLASLLRNQVWQLLTVFDSGFNLEAEEEPADPGYDTADLEDTYESYTYSGDDLDRRFPGIDWYCDRCGSLLNGQEHFDDHQPVWKCTRCGYKNCIDIDNISHSEEDFLAGKPPIDAEKFYRATKERTDELDL